MATLFAFRNIGTTGPRTPPIELTNGQPCRAERLSRTIDASASPHLKAPA